MNDVVPIPAAKKYWNLIKNSSNEVKLNLIELIYISLRKGPKITAEDCDDVLDKISSSWPDDGLTADEFVEVCESGRNKKREIVEI